MDFNVLRVEVFSRLMESVSELVEWELKPRILAMIQAFLTPPDVDNEEPVNNDLFAESVFDEVYLPRLQEKEPNNTSKKLNGLPPSTLMIGYISSRADEDLFQLKRNTESATLEVEWIRIGKTTLSPQLRLYDQALNFVSKYSLSKSQNKIKFQYTFEQGVPRKVYLRVTDKVGFIQGETGGFKSFYYLLRYQWLEGESVFKNEEPGFSIPGLVR